MVLRSICTTLSSNVAKIWRHWKEYLSCNEGLIYDCQTFDGDEQESSIEIWIRRKFRKALGGL